VIGLASFQAVCLDAHDVPRVADFWATVLGHSVHLHDEGYASLSGGEGPGIWVNPVPEPKTVKDRVHLDVQLRVDDPQSLLALGATLLREPGGDISWWVLADPEGHEFCAFPPPAQVSAFENDADAEQTA
jgi:catechol 2,3-dioxygenase-like lactoylglutathione lyase family enzyme